MKINKKERSYASLFLIKNIEQSKNRGAAACRKKEEIERNLYQELLCFWFVTKFF